MAERRKKPNLFVMQGLYERAITEADKRRWAGEAGAEQALRSFWAGYLDFIVRVMSSPQNAYDLCGCSVLLEDPERAS